MTTPLRRFDLLAAYGTAFSIAAAAQAVLACVVSFWLLGFTTAGSAIWVFIIAILNAVLGIGTGTARKRFRANRIPGGPVHAGGHSAAAAAGGIIVPRSQMPEWLQWVSNAMPASYALEALQQVNRHEVLTDTAIRDMVVVLAFAAERWRWPRRRCAGARRRIQTGSARAVPQEVRIP